MFSWLSVLTDDGLNNCRQPSSVINRIFHLLGCKNNVKCFPIGIKEYSHTFSSCYVPFPFPECFDFTVTMSENWENKYVRQKLVFIASIVPLMQFRLSGKTGQTSGANPKANSNLQAVYNLAYCMARTYRVPKKSSRGTESSRILVYHFLSRR